jgi:hypothetical protein
MLTLHKETPKRFLRKLTASFLGRKLSNIQGFILVRLCNTIIAPARL